MKCLEYRGYDSVGLAIVSSGPEIRKDVGKIDDPMVKSKLEEIEGKTWIGHTRWDTYGPVNSADSHPHADCTGKNAIIHNGIIENHYELRYLAAGCAAAVLLKRFRDVQGQHLNHGSMLYSHGPSRRASYRVEDA